MRATLDDPALTRQAGRFVWLELDFDKPGNQPFIARRGVSYTPSLYVLDPADERATATHLGGLTLPALNQFLDEGERGFRGKATSPADAALARGDEQLGHGDLAGAAKAFREAIGLAPPGWPERTHAVGSLTWSLWVGGETQACAETAAVEAPAMARGQTFGAVVLAGFASSNQGGDAPWAETTRKILEPLAEEAVVLPSALRDHRFQLYQSLMGAARNRGDTVAVLQWSKRWLDEIEATTPKDDNERSALDIARKDALVDTDELPRILPPLLASEKAMPANYSASLRVAEVQLAANHFDEAIAACDRGLVRATGPVGKSWLLRIKGSALTAKGDTTAARRTLGQALEAARAIGNEQNRNGNVQRISWLLSQLDKGSKPAR